MALLKPGTSAEGSRFLTRSECDEDACEKGDPQDLWIRSPYRAGSSKGLASEQLYGTMLVGCNFFLGY